MTSTARPGDRQTADSTAHPESVPHATGVTMHNTTSTMKLLIATHHKTGTVLMKRVFTEIASLMGSTPCLASRGRLPPADWQLLLDMHSTVLASLPTACEDIRALHVIRDPRMVVVSSALYHMHSKERWLHVPRPDLDGRTYQEHLISLPDNISRFRYELDHGAAGLALRDLDIISRLDQPWRLDVKLEALMEDHDLALYKTIFRHLELPESIMSQALEIALGHSVFNSSFSDNRHVRARQPEDWRTHLPMDFALDLERRFPGLACRLGYESLTLPGDTGSHPPAAPPAIGRVGGPRC